MSGVEEGWPSGEAVPDGDNYMTESAKEPIPDSADFEPNPVEPAFTPAEIDEILGNNPDSTHQDLLCPHCGRVVDSEPDEVGPALVDCGGMNCPGHVMGEGEERCPTSEERYGG